MLHSVTATHPTTTAYLSRLQRLSLLDGDGVVIGRVEDVVLSLIHI